MVAAVVLNHADLAEKIAALLPQTQCRRCTFADCKAYAEAVANQQADINQCPPGGDETVLALATLLGKTPKSVDPAFGEIKVKSRAVIVEADCIGCTKCLAACPVDAILGSNKLMHTVIADECTGCELCIAPCPVDCIVMQPIADEIAVTLQRDEVAARAKHRYQVRQQRQIEEQAERARKQKQALEEMKAKMASKKI